MDINDLRSLATVLVAVAFVGIVWWAFGPSRKKYFEEAAQLPFADESPEEETRESDSQDSDSQDSDSQDSETQSSNILNSDTPEDKVSAQQKTDDKHKGDKP